MNRIARIAAVMAPLLVAAPAVAALSQRTFVASTGSDAHACSIAAPCRGFAVALSHTAPGGEIIVLDSAGYGPLTITQSVSIVAPPGVYAGISVSSGDGITINGANIVVILRGLSINGTGGNSGIRVVQAAHVSVESCTVSNMAYAGLYASSAGTAIVRDSAFRSNYIGISADTSSATAPAALSIDNVVTADNTFAGVNAVAGTNTAAKLHVTLDNSVIESTAADQFGVSFSDSGAVEASLDASIVRTKLTSNRGGTGIAAAGSATTVSLAECHIAGWNIGAETFNGASGAGTIQSLQNNTFIGNSTNTEFPLTGVTPL